ncbi:retropepsin-like aspartic protease family protein [Sulfuriflexus mobilis]|uniref:retropepsin-like aspartic protease family protein n=1 Tax=Sulfuriflexus mobilis TaxID=1811807 RepID=UPI000F819C89|nr:TIGR02281 family clan AA aspartic protease [Sulfuriflexus mobilis]
MDDRQSHSTQGIGKAMTTVAWLLALALFAWVFAGLEERENNPNQFIATQQLDDGGKSITLQRNRYGHYVADGFINDVRVTFLLDTGASDISVPGSLAEKLGLRRGPAQQYNTANGVITGYLTRLDSVRLGDIELHDVRASINPRNQGDELLLGMSFLRDLEFTQRGHTLTIQQNQ